MPDPQPLIILTCMRSYSSLVSTMLGQHPGLYALPEINPFVAPTLARFVKRAMLVRPRTLDGIYRAIAEVERGEQSEASIGFAKAWVNEREDWTVGRVLEHLAERVSPRRVIDKSPSTVLTDAALELALTQFPDAHFLHLCRHPVATTRSIARITRHGSGGRAGKDPEDSWYGANRRILREATVAISLQMGYGL